MKNNKNKNGKEKTTFVYFNPELKINQCNNCQYHLRSYFRAYLFQLTEWFETISRQYKRYWQITESTASPFPKMRCPNCGLELKKEHSD